MQKSLQGLGKCPGLRRAKDQEGRPALLGVGPGISPGHGALEQGSLHQASRLKGRTVMAPYLPVQMENPPNKGCYLGICPGLGLRVLYVAQICPEPLGRAESWRQATCSHVSEVTGLAKKVIDTNELFGQSNIFFKAFLTLLTNWPFPHHCLKVCMVYNLFISCFHKTILFWEWDRKSHNIRV